MNEHWNPRKKKVQPSPAREMKNVKIDFRTTIIVPIEVPDDVAKERYLARINQSVRGRYVSVAEEMPKEIAKEMPVVSLEEVAALIDDSNLPESE
jgi:hypothetical protein